MDDSDCAGAVGTFQSRWVHEEIGHLDMGLGFSNVIVAEHQHVYVRILVALGTEELFLADIDELLDESMARSRSHDTVTKATHGLVTENIRECVLLSDRILAAFAGHR